MYPEAKIVREWQVTLDSMVTDYMVGGRPLPAGRTVPKTILEFRKY
jgi:hypothetical protein